MDFSNMFKGIGGFFSVGSPVTPMSNMGAPDVIKTQNALADLGYFNAEMPDVSEGLKSFQADNGLKVDGIMNPNGETENALGQALSNQGASGMDMLEKAGKALPNNITLNQPDTSNPDNRSWSASASFGEAPAKPKAAPKPKVDPMTGLKDPLAKSPMPKKSKAEMDKLWEQVAEKQKPKAAIIPQGDTVDERLRSMMTHPEYAKKKTPQVVQHIQDEFKRAYPGNVEYDETGKMIQPKPVIQANDVRAYDLNKELETMRFQPEVQQDLDDVMAYTVSDNEEKTAQASSYEKEEAPVISNEGERRQNLLDDKAGRFDVKDNPEADGSYRMHEVPAAGRIMLNQYDSTIQKMADKHGTDPDLLRAVMWAENSRGHYMGWNWIADIVGVSDSKMPMNINPKLWGSLLGREADLSNPADNIEASAILLKRIGKRVGDENKIARIGSVWNGTGQNETSDFGEYIARVHREKPWLNKPFE